MSQMSHGENLARLAAACLGLWLWSMLLQSLSDVWNAP